jgi:hypothetical protein
VPLAQLLEHRNQLIQSIRMLDGELQRTQARVLLGHQIIGEQASQPRLLLKESIVEEGGREIRHRKHLAEAASHQGNRLRSHGLVPEGAGLASCEART